MHVLVFIVSVEKYEEKSIFDQEKFVTIEAIFLKDLYYDDRNKL